MHASVSLHSTYLLQLLSNSPQQLVVCKVATLEAAHAEALANVSLGRAKDSEGDESGEWDEG